LPCFTMALMAARSAMAGRDVGHVTDQTSKGSWTV
jgi:hypothetical protein